MTRSLAVIGLLPLVAACYTTRTTSSTWGEPYAYGWPEQRGRVAWVRETVQQQEGNPAGGAAAGAVIGGLLGHAITGDAGGAVLGAAGGAVAGAAASQGSAERRLYDVGVRFEDGSLQVFRFAGSCPFRVGQAVTWTADGLRPRPRVLARPPPPPPPPPR